jgi:hypothetical protein
MDCRTLLAGWFPAKSILDWFHISMRVRYLEQIPIQRSAKVIA